jgi:hypothetical protein
VHPITSLQNKGVRFEWTSDCVRSFQHLKSLLTSAPILRIVNPNEDFIVRTDACKEGLGGVLCQNGHAIFYKSRKLKENERLYDTHDLELASMVHALKMWRRYLMGKIFELRIDHSGLKCMFGQPSLNAIQRRWIEFLSEDDFDIKHIRGNENKVVGALIRRVHKLHATTISMYKSYFCDRILEVSKSYQCYVGIKMNLQQGMSQQKLEVSELKEDGILMYRHRVYVPNV